MPVTALVQLEAYWEEGGKGEREGGREGGRMGADGGRESGWGLGGREGKGG